LPFDEFRTHYGKQRHEVRHVTWRDIDFRDSVVRVTAKPLWGFGPTNWEESAVPLPTALVEQLQKLRERRNGLPSQPVFRNTKGNPYGENDMIVKRVAERAELNCG
jgi:integrase/recombinase XerD